MLLHCRCYAELDGAADSSHMMAATTAGFNPLLDGGDDGECDEPLAAAPPPGVSGVEW